MSYPSDDLTVRQLIRQSFATAKEKGWWEDGINPETRQPNRNFPEQLMLMVTELAEAMEEWRNEKPWVYTDMNRAVTVRGLELGKPEGILAELADVFIRIGDTVGAYGLETLFLKVLDDKLKYNKHRSYRHGNKRA